MDYLISIAIGLLTSFFWRNFIFTIIFKTIGAKNCYFRAHQQSKT